MSTNDFNGNTFAGATTWAFDRAKMLAGLPATAQTFHLSSSYFGLLPSSLDGRTPPPAGSPDYFVSLGTSTSLNLWKFHADFSNAANSTLVGPSSISVTGFTELCGGLTCIPQAGTGQKLDSLADRLMYRLAYRNFGDHEALVVTHSVAPGAGGGGVRWYEIRNPGGTPVVYQQSTYAPDTQYRWMASAAMDRSGDIGVGYSLSSSKINPAIAYTGRAASDPLNTLRQAETVLVSGTGSQLPKLSRWGDYSSMVVDPTDDCTFWYTTEYLTTNGTFNWHTRIGTFKFPSCVPLAAPAITSATGATFTESSAGTFTVTTTGVPTPAITETGALPSGVTFTDNANGTATLAGTPAAATSGTYPITMSAANGVLPNASQTFTLTVTGTHSLSGTLTGIGGATLPGAAVHAFDAATGAYVGGANPDALGAFAITLPPGTYKLWIQPNTAGYPNQWYGGGGASFAAATPVDLTVASAIVNITVGP